MRCARSSHLEQVAAAFGAHFGIRREVIGVVAQGGDFEIAALQVREDFI